MSEVTDFLEHYGVKGMKWGVRRADKKWQKNIYSIKGFVDLHNNVADQMNNGLLEKLNSQPKYKKLDAVDNPNSPLSKQYYKEYESINAAASKRAVAQVHGVSPSGTMKASLDMSNPNQWSVKVTSTDLVQSADSVLPELVMDVEHDNDGSITYTRKVSKSELAQSEDLDGQIDDFLEHFGVKGMKWGKRNQKRLARANRVGKGTASKGDKAIFALTDTSANSISRNKGLQGAGKIRAKELGRRKARIEAGKAGVRDYIALKGGDKLFITGSANSGKKAKLMTPKTKKRVAAGALFTAQMGLSVANASANSSLARSRAINSAGARRQAAARIENRKAMGRMAERSQQQSLNARANACQAACLTKYNQRVLSLAREALARAFNDCC